VTVFVFVATPTPLSLPPSSGFLVSLAIFQNRENQTLFCFAIGINVGPRTANVSACVDDSLGGRCQKSAKKNAQPGGWASVRKIGLRLICRLSA
jgi:hypothetical protein